MVGKRQGVPLQGELIDRLTFLAFTLVRQAVFMSRG
jgi:hypothetical protein